MIPTQKTNHLSQSWTHSQHFVINSRSWASVLQTIKPSQLYLCSKYFDFPTKTQSVEEIQIRLEWQNYIITTQGCCNEEWIFKAMFRCASLLWNERFLSSILSPADCRHKTKGWRERRHNSNWIMHQQSARVESYFPPWRISLIRNQIQVKEESQSIQKSLSHCK